MPALVNSRVGSLAGTSEELRTMRWPRSAKKSRKRCLISEPVTENPSGSGVKFNCSEGWKWSRDLAGFAAGLENCPKWDLPFTAWLVAFWASVTGVTFSHDVAPILYRNCASCHRSGGVAPFSLIGYEDAAKRAALIATVTSKRYMPRWLPSEPHFQHERRLTDQEIATLVRW